MNYYDEIDPIGEEKQNNCNYCGKNCKKTYCSKNCKLADND